MGLIIWIGNYVYIEASGRRPNDTARFVSPQMSIDSTGSCIKFWYNMYGSDINQLNLYASTSEWRFFMFLYICISLHRNQISNQYLKKINGSLTQGENAL